jgi:hypothetical protein
MEVERLVGLVDQCRNMTDVNRLFDIGELVLLPQALEEFAKVFVHHPFLFGSGGAFGAKPPAFLSAREFVTIDVALSRVQLSAEIGLLDMRVVE